MYKAMDEANEPGKSTGQKQPDFPQWVLWTAIISVLLMSLGVFLVGQYHSQFGVLAMVVGGLMLYAWVIYAVFKL